MMRFPLLRLLLLAFCASSATASAVLSGRRPFAPLQIGAHRALRSFGGEGSPPSRRRRVETEDARGEDTVVPVVDGLDLWATRGGAKASRNRPLAWAYAAAGVATTAAWSTIVWTTIRSNQPLGAMMPTFQHGFYARIGAMSAASVMVASYRTLVTAASHQDALSTRQSRRQNLALVAACGGSALWVAYAGTITKIPGTVLSHQAYQGALRTALMAAYGSAASLSAAVWAWSLPADVRRQPWTWPGRIADGVAQSLVSLAPTNPLDPVQTKYALLASGFLFWTALPLVASHPISVIPSWTGRRLARAFPAWTLLAAVAALNCKEAAAAGTLPAHRPLAQGLTGFGALYLGAKVGAIFLDPSFPQSYHAVNQVPGLAAAAILFMGLTLRSDRTRPATTAAR
jgi:hypothetical protein